MTAEPQSTEREGLSRRTVMAGVAVAGVGTGLLAACGSDTEATDPEATDSPGTDSSSPSSGEESSPAGGGDALASTADVAVGGAVFLEDPSVVITQPTEGDFHAFNRACTHQGCPVVDIVDGNIHCSCHGSMFSMTDGAAVQGPATQPLTVVDITVEGDQILPA